MKKIVISGYYGFDNAGDEAVLAGLKKSILREAAGADITIEALSIAPEKTAAFHKISAAHRMKTGPLLRSIASSDLFISGGGSLLQDATSRRSIFYYLAATRIAQILGKKTMFAAQGIGPLNLARSRKLTASVANRLDWITVRDNESAALLKEIGVVKPRIDVVADPALLLSRQDFDDGHSSEFDALRNRDCAAVSLRNWGNRSGEIAKTLGAAWKKSIPHITPIPMPMRAEEDASICAAFSSGCGERVEPRSYSLPQLFDLASSVPMVVGMRLHSLIFASAASVPSVALSYDPKVASFMAQTRQNDAVYYINEPDDNRLAQILALVWNEREQRRERLSIVLPTLRENASLTAKRVIALLK